MIFPSCLILGYRLVDNKAVHIVVGFNGKRMLIIDNRFTIFYNICIIFQPPR